MSRPAEPHYSFDIPSLHDGTALDCRIYHPPALPDHASAGPAPWRKRGLAMAHPYAPMGGSYDDRVVGIVLDEFLQAGWMVGTFNFRGAPGSKGRSSWSGRPERDDYMSFAALFIHYMHYIQPSVSLDSSAAHDTAPVAPTVALGGYSYGSLILKHLPPVPTILQPFSAPAAGSFPSEILSRARWLSSESNSEWLELVKTQQQEQRAQRKGHTTRQSLTMGGDEASPDQKRSSRHIRTSHDERLSLEFGTPEHRHTVAITFPHIRYLLVSPLSGPVATLAAPALAGKLWGKRDASHDCIGKYPTIAIYGDQDIFTSAKKTRDWSQKLSESSGANFSSIEIAGAGHFWVEDGVVAELRSALRVWQSSAS